LEELYKYKEVKKGVDKIFRRIIIAKYHIVVLFEAVFHKERRSYLV